MIDAVLCAGCREPVPNDTLLSSEQRVPCPTCGSVARAQTRGAVDIAGAGDLIASASLTLGPGPRPWTEAWALLNQAFERVEMLYASREGALQQFEMINFINDFFISCYHLKDYLKRDTNVLPQVRSAVESFVHSEHALALAGDIANTVKHRERRPGQRYARIGELNTGPKIAIHWTAPDGSTGSEDVLDLARAAMQEWRTFLHSHNML